MFTNCKQTSSISNGFDRIAFIYDTLTSITSFNQINKSQLAFISHLSIQSTCLILGGGTGYFLQKLLEENENICVTYVDASEKMIQLAQKRIAKNIPNALHRVTFICEGIENFEFGKYDIIVCNYFLDLFEDIYVNFILDKLYRSINNQGLLYITDFTKPNTKEALGWILNIGIKGLYLLFKWTTSLSTKNISNIHEIVLENHFNRIQMKKFFNGILCCNVYEKITNRIN